MSRRTFKFLLAFTAVAVSANAAEKPFVAPEAISYGKVPGYAKVKGLEILEWSQKSATAREPRIPASLTAPAGLKLRWLGTAGFEISDDDTTILVDPFLSRPGMVDTLLLKKLKVDTAAVDHYLLNSINPRKLKAILVSHTHHDHVEDVPYIVAQYPAAVTRPLVVGDENVGRLLKAYDERERQVPWVANIDKLSLTPQKIISFDKKLKNNPPFDRRLGHPIGTFGSFKITAYVSEHGFYDYYPFAKLSGDLKAKPPLRSTQYPSYLHSSMTYLIEYKNRFKIFINDSPVYLHSWRVGQEVGKVNLLLQGIASRKRHNKLPEMISRFRPDYLVPTHFDNFFKGMRKFKEFDYKIKLPMDHSRVEAFIKDFGQMCIGPCPKLRFAKMFYYYSLEPLVARP